MVRIIKKLILLDEDENVYEIKNPKYFEQEVPVEDLKAIYQDIYTYITLNDLLEEMVEDGLLFKQCEDEKTDNEINDNLAYTLKFLGKILEQKIGIEFEVFKEEIEEEFYKAFKTINKKEGLVCQIIKKT